MSSPDYSDPAEAVCAPTDGSPITRAAFVPIDRNYQVCTRCVMDTTDPEIDFDEHGVCNHCRHFDSVIKSQWPTLEQGGLLLTNMIETLKLQGTGKSYDCIIGLSGGVDSSYCALKVAEWGLRPLVVHVDAGWNSELAVMNIEQICKRLGFDLVTHVIDWEEMRDMQLAFLRSNLANQDAPQDHAFFAALYGYAEKAGIKYVINGSNFATESILPRAWGYDAMDATLLKGIHSRFGTRPRGKFPVINFFDLYVKYPHLLKMEVLKPLNFLPYRKQDAIETLERDLGWRYYGGKHFESRWSRFFQAYYLPYKFGYDKRKAHLSSLILDGQMDRSDALDALNQPLYDERLLLEDKTFIAKKLKLSVAEFEDLINQPIRHYSEYPNHQKKLRVIRYVYRTIRKMISTILGR
ncbi:N-acetyl sugar amidotransferase [Limnohabitans sp. TS-CS-82]|uniref:N-acetyl sugar amidotransferase n=1 Tax=Limnohabitans sp. TS-CS-82 TaxID=2094193 RepID=UPI000CF2F3AE|nr:N-acetyl sugar amidotransferase [Limnohabitans sp. TS-CS-82]PQA84827.1 N-acetyl sugar amidotransferase [Limnohabitans sp. TS-CS-82]